MGASCLLELERAIVAGARHRIRVSVLYNSRHTGERRALRDRFDRCRSVCIEASVSEEHAVARARGHDLLPVRAEHSFALDGDAEICVGLLLDLASHSVDIRTRHSRSVDMSGEAAGGPANCIASTPYRSSGARTGCDGITAAASLHLERYLQYSRRA